MNESADVELSLLKQYYEIVEETNIISKTDTRGIITYANKKFIEISGYTEKELLGKSHNIVRDPSTPSSTFKNMWATIKSKQVWQGVITNLRKDGTKYTVDASVFPILDTNGDVVEYIAIRHDITEILALREKIEELDTYRIEQEKIALDKITSGIVNDASSENCKVLFIPSDTLSGDFYSVYKLKNGATFIYILDGQGHGASPALTVFAISSVLNQVIHQIESVDELIEQLAPSIKLFLGEIEQLSYTLIMISPDAKSISYSSGGMYPFLIKSGDEIIKVKANNNPLMNFSALPVVSSLEIDSWESLILYSDGLVEHEIKELSKYKPDMLIKEPSLMEEAITEISSHKFEDDVTMIYFKNS
jgi:PAS domain S-box-containing protein